MKTDIVYLKIAQSCQVVNKRITLQDVAEIQASDAELVKSLGNIVLYTVKGDKDEKLIFSVIKIIGMIQKEYPGLQIDNIGESDFVVEYKIPKQTNKAMEYLKVAFVALIVFFGSAFTIMTFNTDVSVGEVFSSLYMMVLDKPKGDMRVVELAYSIGIPVGILGFYNHFKGAKLHDDPTPLHVEMRVYEEELNKAIIQDADREGKELKK